MRNSSASVRSLRIAGLAILVAAAGLGACRPNGTGGTGGSVLQNNTGLRGTFGLALGKADVIYAANHGDNGTPPSITVYAPDTNGNIAPSTVITGPASGLSRPQGLVIRQNTDSILVANWVDPPAAGHDSSIIEIPVASVDSRPSGSVGGGSAGISAPGGVALDYTSHVYVSESASNRILVFEPRPGTMFDRAPIRTIAGPNTLLNRQRQCRATAPPRWAGRYYFATAATLWHRARQR
jgi:hypothetical protein